MAYKLYFFHPIMYVCIFDSRIQNEIYFNLFTYLVSQAKCMYTWVRSRSVYDTSDDIVLGVS